MISLCTHLYALLTPKRVVHLFTGSLHLLPLLLTCFFSITAVAQNHSEAVDPPVKLLLISSGAPHDPVSTQIVLGINTLLLKHDPGNTLFEEYIDVIRKPDATIKFIDAIIDRYNNTDLTAIVTYGFAAHNLVKNNIDRLPTTNIISSFSVDPHQDDKSSRIKYVGHSFEPDVFVDEIIRLADPKHITLIGGSRYQNGAHFERIKQGLNNRGLGSKVDTVFDPSVEMLNKLPLTTPPNSVVIVTPFFSPNGWATTHYHELEKLAALISVPIFSMASTTVGSGVVGGNVFSYIKLGEELAELALNGEGLNGTIHQLVYDGVVLDKFGFSENDLLPNTTLIRPFPPSFLDQYKYTIIIVVTLAVTILLIYLGVIKKALYKSEVALKHKIEKLNATNVDLINAKQQLEIAVTVGKVGLFNHNLTKGIDHVNEVAREILELSHVEFPIIDFHAILRRVDPKQHDEIHKFFDAKETDDLNNDTFEFRVHTPHKGLRYVLVRLTKNIEQDGCLYLRGSIIDITELRRVENRLRSELAKQEQLFAIIGHELRTPTSALKMLIEDQKIAEQEPNGQLIADTIEHLLRVLDDMRIITRPELVLDSPQSKDAVPAVIERSLPLLGRLLIEKGLSVVVESSPQSRVHCVLREQLLRQIALNLVKNAALHAHASRMLISIDAEDLGAEVRYTLEFADNGIGVRPELQDNIFKAFERGDTQSDGTGLGLHVSKTYAQQILKGDLTYRQNTPKGAIFILTAVFPKTSQALEQANAKQAQIAKSDILKGTTVLFAEDTPVLRMTTVRQLEMQGAEVVVAIDGLDAIKAAKEFEFDWVLTDIFMPNLDGYGLTRYLRESGFNGPIIGITAAVVGDETQMLLGAGANAVLPKPLVMGDLKTLFAKSQHLMTKRPVTPSALGNKRILVIDDDPFTLGRFEALLNTEYEVATETSAVKAVEIFRRFQPDLVLCDINMPDISGFEVLKELQSLSPSTPIIQMSSTDKAEHFLKIAKSMGASQVFDKTANNEMILAMIQMVLTDTNT